MNEPLNWDELVSTLRAELQEKRDLLCLLNAQTETLYRRDAPENERLENQIREQTEVVAQRHQAREVIFRRTANRLNLPDGATNEAILAHFPPYVQPFLESLSLDVDALSGRLGSRLLQNQDLKSRFLTIPAMKVS